MKKRPTTSRSQRLTTSYDAWRRRQQLTQGRYCEDNMSRQAYSDQRSGGTCYQCGQRGISKALSMLGGLCDTCSGRKAVGRAARG